MPELETILQSAHVNNDDKESAIYEMARIIMNERVYEKLAELCQSLRKLWPNLTGARASKIMKKIVGFIPPQDFNIALHFEEKMIDWCQKEELKYLKLFFQTKRVGMLYEIREYEKCLENISELATELKKMNDKANLITLYIYESKTYYEMQNMPRAKASLTSARALAVTTFSPSYIQAQIELLAGMYLCEDRQYTSAFSNFMEALDGFNQSKCYSEACLTVRYLVLSKIIANRWNEIGSLLKNKGVQSYLGDDIIKILVRLGESCKKRNLSGYDKIIRENYETIKDNFILSHLAYLNDLLLDSNILKLIEPYLNVSISYLAEELNFPVSAIEAKLRKLILDGRINGILDYYTGTLVMYEKGEDSMIEKNYFEMVKAILLSVDSNNK
ncbi:hypothetical protein VCUG_01850 [Vavraia culicis subsp. floridensis]|uniref:PCI domain-containing protein n=1 Tax=Vavraia culicis (isolate floridensis) TaxID=948595 RepID=L2GSL6_VAVCU|nr:uncharacterized protein VCUG_01850 [Vavraia culicis subsp. floridensis]ELA46624.1 hypothetical protein VCUG_01850 [Vavraia culicis subsp. floridensis]